MKYNPYPLACVPGRAAPLRHNGAPGLGRLDLSPVHNGMPCARLTLNDRE